jgi:hypothetical protein
MKDAMAHHKPSLEDFKRGSTSTQDEPGTSERSNSGMAAPRVSYLAQVARLVVMAGAIGALLYRWKAENAPLLLLAVGFFAGFMVSFLRRSLSGRK